MPPKFIEKTIKVRFTKADLIEQFKTELIDEGDIDRSSVDLTLRRLAHLVANDHTWSEYWNALVDMSAES